MDLSKVGASALPGIGGVKGLGQDGAGAGSFGDILKGMVGQAVDAQKQAESLTLAAANGDKSVSLNDVVQAVSKAELTLQTLVTVRDKAVEAYQQIIQMPV
ncbi:MAG: flagellar hook-basal body complex protein FliE [Proteobacteria bacterium]|nr:flagellar hook-basal body complex protein FliE [Pseudomonadota bacterium]